jgi:hypothetical protein
MFSPGRGADFGGCAGCCRFERDGGGVDLKDAQLGEGRDRFGIRSLGAAGADFARGYKLAGELDEVGVNGQIGFDELEAFGFKRATESGLGLPGGFRRRLKESCAM